MTNWKDKPYVVLEFAAVPSSSSTNETDDDNSFDGRIIEVAAIRIEKGKIVKQFSSFVSLDETHDSEYYFEATFSTYGATEEHLVGAPDFVSVAQQVYEICKDSTLVVRSLDKHFYWFHIFEEQMRECGYTLSGQVYPIDDLYSAFVVRQKIIKEEKDIRDMNVLELSQFISVPSATWENIFVDNGIFLTVKLSSTDVRRDSLSWALAFANLFLCMIEED